MQRFVFIVCLLGVAACDPPVGAVASAAPVAVTPHPPPSPAPAPKPSPSPSPPPLPRPTEEYQSCVEDCLRDGPDRTIEECRDVYCKVACGDIL